MKGRLKFYDAVIYRYEKNVGRRIATTALRCSCVARRRIDRTPTPTAALRRIYDAFTRTGSNKHTVAAIGVPRYSCSHSLKRVERVLQPRRLFFEFAFLQLIQSIVFTQPQGYCVLKCVISFILRQSKLHMPIFRRVENAGGKNVQRCCICNSKSLWSFFLFFFNKEKVITWCLIIVFRLRLRLIIITYGLLGKWFEKNE